MSSRYCPRSAHTRAWTNFSSLTRAFGHCQGSTPRQAQAKIRSREESTSFYWPELCFPPYPLLRQHNQSTPPTASLNHASPGPRPGRGLGSDSIHQISTNGCRLNGYRTMLSATCSTGPMTPPQTASRPHVQEGKTPLRFAPRNVFCSSPTKSKCLPCSASRV